jgi:hypothetical protein
MLLRMISPMCLQVFVAWHPYRDLQGELGATIVGRQRIENGWKLLRVEFDWN